VRHPVGATCFVFCVNLSPPIKLAECFAKNLNTLDRLVFREKILSYNFVPQYSTPNICRINRLEVSFANPARVILGIIVTIMFVYTAIVAKRSLKSTFSKKV
jgi:hypothetical protein